MGIGKLLNIKGLHLTGGHVRSHANLIIIADTKPKKLYNNLSRNLNFVVVFKVFRTKPEKCRVIQKKISVGFALIYVNAEKDKEETKHM